MNVYQMSMVAVMGLLVAVAGAGQLVGDSVYPFLVGFAVCIAFLVQAVRVLQRQLDELKSSVDSRSAEKAQQ